VRLLWAARLNTEKGLHTFLSALALLRHDLPLRLTILAAPGAGPYRGPYRSRIERLIQRLQVADLIDFWPAVSRAELPGVLAAHDALLFDSVFSEPVAQILLLAFAHGLIVVGPASGDPRSLLQPAETAFCFTNRSAGEVAAAIRRAVSDAETRRTIRERAFERVKAEHTLAGTIAAYDALLRNLADLPRAGRTR
jgi:glycosyltransferase involved in cell wall biosynthesis